jgi:hypothetical protein
MGFVIVIVIKLAFVSGLRGLVSSFITITAIKSEGVADLVCF